MSDPLRDDRPLFVTHHHPGRLRVRSPLFDRDPKLSETLAGWLTEQAGVRLVQRGAQTGSLLVGYDPSRTDGGRLLEGMARRGELDITVPPRPGIPAQGIFDAARALDRQVAAWSDGRFDLRLALPVALGLGSVASFFVSDHRRIPRWDNLLYWSVHFFRTLNEDARDERPPGRLGVREG
jgi:hypothetical protein